MEMHDPHTVTTSEQGPDEVRAHQGEDLAALLSRLLDQAPGRSQKDLATAAGIPHATVNAWINRSRGTSRIDPEKLRALRQVFQTWGVSVSMREFFEAVGRPVPGPSDDEREARLLTLYRQLPVEKQRDLVRDAETMLRISRVS